MGICKFALIKSHENYCKHLVGFIARLKEQRAAVILAIPDPVCEDEYEPTANNNCKYDKFSKVKKRERAFCEKSSQFADKVCKLMQTERNEVIFEGGSPKIVDFWGLKNERRLTKVR